jgi:hypothetical protein
VAGRTHPNLHKTTGATGLPDLAFFDAAGALLLKIPYAKRKTGAGIVAGAARAERYLELRTRAAQKDDRAQVEFLILQLEERQLSTKQAEARRRALTAATPEESQLLDQLLLELRVGDVLRGAPRGEAGRAKAGKELAKWWAEGKRPRPIASRGWWYAILAHAEATEDLALFDQAYAALETDLNTTDKGAAWIPRTLEIYRKMRAALADRLK